MILEPPPGVENLRWLLIQFFNRFTSCCTFRAALSGAMGPSRALSTLCSILDVRGLITIVATILWRANGEILCSAFAFLQRLHAGTNMLHQTPAIGHLVDG